MSVCIPESYPPFEAVYPSLDGDALRVMRKGGEPEMAFDVFDADGRYLGQIDTDVDLPRLRSWLVTHDAIYAVDTDELGVNYVVVLRIERP